MSSDFESSSTPHLRHWLMFLMRPTDVLELLHIISNPTSRFAAGSMPPDVKVIDTFFDEERDLLGLMLESEFFEPVEVAIENGSLVADWPRALFSLAQTDETELDEGDLWGESETIEELNNPEAATALGDNVRAAIERGFHLRAFNFAASDLLLILRSTSARDLPEFPVYKRDTDVLGCIPNQQFQGWTLILEHPDFEPARVYEEEDMAFVEPTSDGHDVKVRFGLPDSHVERRIEIDPDALEN